MIQTNWLVSSITHGPSTRNPLCSRRGRIFSPHSCEKASSSPGLIVYIRSCLAIGPNRNRRKCAQVAPRFFIPRSQPRGTMHSVRATYSPPRAQGTQSTSRIQGVIDMRRGFSLLWVVLTLVIAAVVGVLSYQAGVATQLPAGAALPPYYYEPHFYGFGLFGILFFLFLLFLVFRIAGFGRRGW